MWESNSPARSFSTAAAAIEASASAASSSSYNNSKKNNNTPTKESLAWFRSRQAQWKGSPRPKMQALPPPLPPYTPPKTKTVDVSVHAKLERHAPVTATAKPSPVASLTTSVPIRQQLPISQPPSMQRASAHPTPSFPSAGASFTPTTPTTRQSLIQTTTTTTATKQQPKQPELKDNTTTADDDAGDVDADANASTPAAAIDYRQFLVDFYTQHNPSKLTTVEQTLSTYQGRYEEMAAKLTAKYVTKTSVKAAAAAVPSPYGLPTGTGPRCFLEFSIGDGENDGNAKGGRVEIQLFADQAPMAVENFRALCTGEQGMSVKSNKPLCYRNNRIHRIVPNMCVQGGDITAGDGTGGESIYRAGSKDADMWGKFRDEVFLQHSETGLLSYANNGPDRNGSQFFFTLRPLPHLNGKHVVFGKIIVDNDKDSGMAVVEEMGRLPTDAKQRPLESVVIRDCGEILPDGTEIRASQLQNGGGTEQQKQPTTTAFNTSGSAATASPFGFGLSQGSTSGGVFGASQSPFSANTSQTTTSIFGSGKPKESAFSAGIASGGSGVATNPFSFSPRA